MLCMRSKLTPLIAPSLYGGSQTNALYILNIDPTDGSADGMAYRVGSVDDFGVGEGIPGGLAVIGNTLYMVGRSTDALYALRYQ